jgi:3-(3-hydroxy-phenyl)propionate hydroxylase
VLFTGDAAHLLPIFGVRGCNTGLQDSNNMAWKLAFVIKGWSHPALLDTYSGERVQAAREICEEGGKSTRFMTPPTAGARLMRDAVLSLTLTEDFPKDLLHWRTSRPHDYHLSPLNSFAEADAVFTDGVAIGQPARNVKLGADDYLFDRIDARAGFHVVLFADDAMLGEDLRQILIEAARQPFPVIRTLVTTRPATSPVPCADLHILDAAGRVMRRYGARSGTVYVLRPDLHVCARWLSTDAAQVCRALHIGAASAGAASAGAARPTAAAPGRATDPAMPRRRPA